MDNSRPAPPPTPPAGRILDALPNEDENHVDREVPAQHVWVNGQEAGLLVGWRKYPDRVCVRWFARVFWCPPNAPYALLSWIPAAQVTKA